MIGYWLGYGFTALLILVLSGVLLFRRYSKRFRTSHVEGDSIDLENEEQKVKQRAFFMQSLQSDVREIACVTQNDVVRRRAIRLLDEIKNIDWIFSDQFGSVERQMEDMVRELQSAVVEERNGDAVIICEQIRKIMIQQRNADSIGAVVYKRK